MTDAIEIVDTADPVVLEIATLATVLELVDAPAGSVVVEVGTGPGAGSSGVRVFRTWYPPPDAVPGDFWIHDTITIVDGQPVATGAYRVRLRDTDDWVLIHDTATAAQAPVPGFYHGVGLDEAAVSTAAPGSLYLDLTTYDLYTIGA